MKKVTWDAGHGKNRKDKRTPDNQAEWTFNDLVVKAGMSYLSNYEGVAQLRVDDPTGVEDVPLKDRTNRANSWGTNLHISVHHNVLNTYWVDAERGVETFAMIGTPNYKESYRLATLVHPRYVKAMGLKDRGIKSNNLHMLREIKAPAILTEGGFMDSRKDIIPMRDPAKMKAQGEAIAEGIVAFFNLKKKGDQIMSETNKPIKLSAGQQIAKDRLVKHGYMAASYQAYTQDMVALITITSAMVRDLERAGVLK